MANKTNLETPLRPAPQARPAQKDEEIENGRMIDKRFRESLRRGETSGDLVVLDEHGNEIVGALPSKSILDF